MKIILLVMALIFSQVAMAKPYVVASVGVSVLDYNIDRLLLDEIVDNPKVAFGIAALSATGNPINIKITEQSSGYRLTAGWKFSDSFSVEGFYADLGSFSAEIDMDLDVGSKYYNITSNGSAAASVSLRGIGAMAVGWVPLGNRISIFGGVGIAVMQAKLKSSSSLSTSAWVYDEKYDTANSQNSNKTDTKIGVIPVISLGFSVHVTDNIDFRADMVSYTIITSGVDTYQVGLQYNF